MMLVLSAMLMAWSLVSEDPKDKAGCAFFATMLLMGHFVTQPIEPPKEK